MLTGFKALSADIENDQVLKLHFDHVVTDVDRAALVDAVNAQRENERLKKELERAYRCIRGFWTAHEKGETLARTPVAYHCTTIGAACRFVSSGALDGAEYFVGKPVEVLHNALNPKRVQ